MARLAQVQAPSTLPVSLAELKAHLKIDDVNLASEDNTLLELYLDAAVAMVDGPQARLGLALISQTWEMRTDQFPDCNQRIELPLPPLVSVDSVTYVDEAGASQTLPNTDYQVLRRWPEAEPG